LIGLRNANARFRIDGMLAEFGVGKPIGVEFTGNPPAPEAVTGHASWSWFLLDPRPAATADPASDEALRKLYADPHIASLPASK
jgi:hypothetical protein